MKGRQRADGIRNLPTRHGNGYSTSSSPGRLGPANTEDIHQEYRVVLCHFGAEPGGMVRVRREREGGTRPREGIEFLSVGGFVGYLTWKSWINCFHFGGIQDCLLDDAEIRQRHVKNTS